MDLLKDSSVRMQPQEWQGDQPTAGVTPKTRVQGPHPHPGPEMGPSKGVRCGDRVLPQNMVAEPWL